MDAFELRSIEAVYFRATVYATFSECSIAEFMGKRSSSVIYISQYFYLLCRLKSHGALARSPRIALKLFTHVINVHSNLYDYLSEKFLHQLNDQSDSFQ